MSGFVSDIKEKSITKLEEESIRKSMFVFWCFINA